MKFEYKFVVGDLNKIEPQINELAKEGWEAHQMSATVGAVVVLLRRPVIE